MRLIYSQTGVTAGHGHNLLLLGNFPNKTDIIDLFGKFPNKPLTLGRMGQYTYVHVLCGLAKGGKHVGNIQ